MSRKNAFRRLERKLMEIIQHKGEDSYLLTTYLISNPTNYHEALASAKKKLQS